ncbi:hypothetical protein BHE90_017269 [Fusarium euwallaceae]|uniref:Uncharacterized protein n=1 Tax=Fusarium euwallaceae TaxID=1147111 RepID=A0A430KY25_9HYPO|nr:hypothetical protein BHE90_017269 [Fusarium euwallaceae]
MTASFQDKREYEAKGETQDMTPTSSRALSSDGETDQVLAVEPRVLHGHTLTKEIPFRDVCIAIWDGLLLEEPAAAPAELPSPDTLRNRLLIKVKYAPPEEPVSASSSDDEEGSKPAASYKMTQDLGYLHSWHDFQYPRRPRTIEPGARILIVRGQSVRCAGNTSP